MGADYSQGYFFFSSISALTVLEYNKEMEIIMNKEVLKNISILYVEDENDVRDFTSKILNPLLKKVFIAQDGEEGLKVFQEKKMK